MSYNLQYIYTRMDYQYVSCHFNYHIETEGLLMSHSLKNGNICKIEMLLVQTTNRKYYVANQIAPFLMTFIDLQGH